MAIQTSGILQTQFYSKVSAEIKNLNYVKEINSRIAVKLPPRYVKKGRSGDTTTIDPGRNNRKLYAADFETYVSNGVQHPLMIGVTSYMNNKQKETKHISKENRIKDTNSLLIS